MDDVESMQVRDLLGEDLDRLAGGSPSARSRFLSEVQEMLETRDDGDLLVIGADGEVWAAAAAGYGVQFDDARIVTAREPRDLGALGRLLADIEVRTIRRRCATLVAAVDVTDEAARRTFERLGYTVTGAAVAVWSERTGAGPPECAVDTWTVRKAVASSASRRSAAGAPPWSPAEEDGLPDEAVAD
ncbi:hypothetical protein LQ327_10340 [Actinomycetospora endophytica]|uniref:N-acetyltransferase domain-containing protein n=1 Tax=Actinomycetospora endophytica TaxID=2291215 RepID=A0ABS8P8C3_9PSEU|nr:hypothetical protein [Actinomycetospora endophytica]MCD2193775.1 hypothetical protein [Actinomycetospora endophytica]